jgi:transcriptional antiterminator RfaH
MEEGYAKSGWFSLPRHSNETRYTRALTRLERGSMEDEILRVEQPLPQWHVLHVAPNHEKKVAIHLLHRSVEHFLPLYRERSQWSDRSVMLERPLFPRYIFVRFARESRGTVISLPGALKVLGRGASDVVDPEDVERIRSALASGYILRPHSAVSVGTRVRVRSGIFTGQEGMVVELRSSCKVVISMSAVRQCYSLETEIGNIEILDKKMIGAADVTLLPGRHQVNW